MFIYCIQYTLHLSTDVTRLQKPIPHMMHDTPSLSDAHNIYTSPNIIRINTRKNI